MCQRFTMKKNFLALVAALCLSNVDAFAFSLSKVPPAPPPLKKIQSPLVQVERVDAPEDLPTSRKPSPPIVNDFGMSKRSNIRAKMHHGYNKYMDLLERKPFVTKSVTAAVVNAIGNVLSQRVTSVVTGKIFQLNLVQVGAFFLTGVAFVGPWCHIWYAALGKFGEKMEHRGMSKGKKTFAQIGIDQTLGVLLFLPFYFYVYEVLESIVAMRAPLLSAAHAQCTAQIGSVLMANYFVWPFFQFVNFSYIPASLRVLATNFMSVLWNCYFCSRIA